MNRETNVPRIVRSKREKHFLVVDNALLRDARLSFRARGLLVFLLSYPDNWTTDGAALAEHSREGRDALRTALGELETAGYLVRMKQQDERGRWSTTSVIYDTPRQNGNAQVTPTTGNPPVGSPAPGFPASVNQAVTTKELGEELTTWRPLRERGEVSNPQPVENPKTHQRDEIWDTLLEVCAIDAANLTTTARGAVNRAVKELKGVDATPAQVRGCAQTFRKLWPGIKLTPSALVKHWATASGPRHPSTPQAARALYDELSPQERHPSARPAGEVLKSMYGDNWRHEIK